MGTGIVTTVNGILLTAGKDVARVTAAAGLLLYAEHGAPVRVTLTSGNLLYADKSNPVQVTQIQGSLLVSTVERAKPAVLRSGQVFGGAIVSKINVVTTPAGNLEPNPYKPILPYSTEAMPDDQAAHADAQQQIMRKQHNLNQAGDTTFPWDLLLEATDSQLYNLGSVGKFFSPANGIIHAVYVEFGQLDANFGYGQMPFGRVKSSTQVDWLVTNNISKSGADLVIGVGQMDNMPTEGQFGWVVIRGTTLATLQPEKYEDLAQDDVYVWNRSGYITRNGIGRVVARVWGKPDTKTLNPGDLLIDIGIWSQPEVESWFTAEFDKLESGLADFKTEIEELRAEIPTGLQQTLDDLATSIGNVRKGLTQEAANRSQEDAKILKLLGKAVSPDDLRAYRLQVSAQLTQLTKQLNSTIRGVKVTADKAKAVTDTLDAASIAEDLANLQGSIDALTLRVTAISEAPVVAVSRFPLVTGSKPPIFVYLEDGSLAYVEI